MRFFVFLEFLRGHAPLRLYVQFLSAQACLDNFSDRVCVSCAKARKEGGYRVPVAILAVAFCRNPSTGFYGFLNFIFVVPSDIFVAVTLPL